MAQTYHQLQYDERRQIHALHQQEASARTIAAQLRRHRSTIYRELRHSSNPSGYAIARPRPAPKSAAGKPSPDPQVPPPWNRICKMLRMEGSPEQIAGCLQRSGEVSGSCSWLYWCIHQDRADGAQLHTCLFLNSAFAACSSSSPVALRCAMGVRRIRRGMRAENLGRHYFERTVALSVLGTNIHRLGRALLAAACKAARRGAY